MFRRIFAFILSGGLVLTLKACISGQNKTAIFPEDSSAASSLYPIRIQTLDGKSTIDFSSFKGKKILIVNTASECGYTPQYEALEVLQNKYKDKLVIIGCPCNQFGGQEPGDTAAIREFCTKNYQITFLLTEKIEVKGKNQHALYAFLTQKAKNGVLDAEVMWNFNKFLLDENGKLLAYFPSKVKPDDPQLTGMIEK
ncbi:MAG: glutathione peroxidase [Bacteroidetes bacterium]|nr:glutathione peroxidase [Bacteroidota bacterium]